MVVKLVANLAILPRGYRKSWPRSSGCGPLFKAVKANATQSGKSERQTGQTAGFPVWIRKYPLGTLWRYLNVFTTLNKRIRNLLNRAKMDTFCYVLIAFDTFHFLLSLACYYNHHYFFTVKSELQWKPIITISSFRKLRLLINSPDTFCTGMGTVRRCSHVGPPPGIRNRLNIVSKWHLTYQRQQGPY